LTTNSKENNDDSQEKKKSYKTKAYSSENNSHKEWNLKFQEILVIIEEIMGK